MDTAAMEASATAGRQSSTGGGDRWSSSTNWIVAGGSLRDAVSFETTYDDEGDDAPSSSVSKPCSLMTGPPSDDGDQDSLPCEVTVCFKGKYELHRVYVKSTARTYEIYYSGNHASNDKEYLCTVRCGASGEEVATSIFSEAATAECQNVDSKPAVIKPHHDSNSSSEDGWIEVQILDDSLEACKGKTLSSVSDICSSSNPQVYYEATAEISDASPCFSITLRFLSLQMKTCVHIAEIYIYADPVDCSSPDASKGMTENFGGNSLLAMFGPSLLQLPKLGTSKLHEKVSSNALGLLKNLNDLHKADQPEGMTSLPDIHSGKGDRSSELQKGTLESKHEHRNSISAPNVIDQKHSHMGSLHIDLAQEHAEIKSETMQLGSSSITADQKLNPVQANNIVPNISPLKCSQASQDQVPLCNQEGKYLSDTRIDKMLCELLSRVGRIEEFCSRFEDNMMKPLVCIETRLQRMEQLFDAFSSGNQCPQPSTRISAPEFPWNESDLENDGRSNSSAARSEETTNISPSLSGEFSTLIESDMHPGLVVKAPEFFNEDDECVQTADSSGFNLNGCSKDKLRPSVDSALASALAAFMMEKPIANVMNSFELSNENKNDLVLTSQMDSLSRKSEVENDVRDTVEVVAADNVPTLSIDMFTEMSDGQNYDYNIEDKLAESTAFSDSLDVGMDHFSPTFPMPSGPRVRKPEASNDDDSIICGKTSELNNKDFHEDKVITHTRSESNPTSASSHLVEFEVLSNSQTSFSPTFETSNHDSHKMPYIFGVPVEGLRDSHSENNGKDEKVEGNGDKLELHEYSSPPIATQHDDKPQDLILWLAIPSSHNASKDSNIGEKGSIPENSSLCDKDQDDLSNVNDVHSLNVPFSIDGSNGQGAEDYGSTKATVESSLLQDYFTVDSDNCPAGYMHKVKPFLDFRPCYDTPILDVKFSREESWKSDISLDILLCETYISDGKDYADRNEDNISQLNFQGAVPVDQLLVEVDPSSINVVSHSCHEEDVQSPQHGEQPFPSLI